jgi:hypothetical protein
MHIDAFYELLSRAQNYRQLALHCVDRLTAKELVALAEDFTALADQEEKKAALQRADHQQQDDPLRLVSSLPGWPADLYE